MLPLYVCARGCATRTVGSDTAVLLPAPDNSVLHCSGPAQRHSDSNRQAELMDTRGVMPLTHHFDCITGMFGIEGGHQHVDIAPQ